MLNVKDAPIVVVKSKIIVSVDKNGVILCANDPGKFLLQTWQRELGQILPEDWLGRVRDAFATGAVVQAEIVCHGRPCLVSIIPAGGLGYATLLGDDVPGAVEPAELYDGFLSTVSHELRTPLALIMGFIETLLAELPGPLTKTQKRFLQNSYKSAGRLLAMVEVMLTATQIQRGLLVLKQEPISVAQAMHTLRETVIDPAAEKGVGLQITVSPLPAGGVPLGDQTQLEWVMLHLVENALKFTPAGGSIGVSSRAEAGAWYFEVHDTGIGIPAADHPRLFERFFRAENARLTQVQGAGVGLAVCRTIIERHGGKIGLTGEPGRGSRAWFSLPLAGGPTERN